MATNQTTNYQLNQWEPTDAVQRVEFNQDNAKLDTALKSLSDQVVQKADQSALNTLISAVNQKAEQEDLDSLEDTVQQISADLTKMTVGTYTGDGAETKVINLGFTPKAVLVMYSWGVMYDTSTTKDSITGGLAMRESPAYRGACIAVEIVSQGFAVHYNTNTGSNQYAYTNRANFPYHYIAFA